jgi:hypothetical protein
LRSRSCCTGREINVDNLVDSLSGRACGPPWSEGELARGQYGGVVAEYGRRHQYAELEAHRASRRGISQRADVRSARDAWASDGRGHARAVTAAADTGHHSGDCPPPYHSGVLRCADRGARWPVCDAPALSLSERASGTAARYFVSTIPSHWVNTRGSVNAGSCRTRALPLRPCCQARRNTITSAWIAKSAAELLLGAFVDKPRPYASKIPYCAGMATEPITLTEREQQLVDHVTSGDILDLARGESGRRDFHAVLGPGSHDPGRRYTRDRPWTACAGRRPTWAVASRSEDRGPDRPGQCDELPSRSGLESVSSRTA